MWAFPIFGESHAENLTPQNKTPIKKHITDLINPNFVDNYHKLASQSDQYKQHKNLLNKTQFFHSQLLWFTIVYNKKVM